MPRGFTPRHTHTEKTFGRHSDLMPACQVTAQRNTRPPAFRPPTRPGQQTDRKAAQIPQKVWQNRARAVSLNWQLNAHNRAGDWYFQSLADASGTPGAEADNHVASSKSGDAEPILTVPMIGWVPKLGPGRARLTSYSIAKYGPQTDNDWQWFPDVGNGVSTTNTLASGTLPIALPATNAARFYRAQWLP